MRFPAEARRRGGEEKKTGGFFESKSLRLCGKLFGESVDAADDSVFEQFFAEVQEVAEFEAGEAEIGLELFLVDGGEAFDGFDFEEHLVGDDDIGTESFVEMDSAEDDVDWNLASDGQASHGEGVGEGDFVNRLE